VFAKVLGLAVPKLAGRVVEPPGTIYRFE
jgi:hypothetical protein